MNGCQAQLILCHILQVLVETHQPLLIVELRCDVKTTEKLQRLNQGDKNAMRLEAKQEDMNYTVEQTGHKQWKWAYISRRNEEEKRNPRDFIRSLLTETVEVIYCR